MTDNSQPEPAPLSPYWRGCYVGGGPARRLGMSPETVFDSRDPDGTLVLHYWHPSWPNPLPLWLGVEPDELEKGMLVVIPQLEDQGIVGDVVGVVWGMAGPAHEASVIVSLDGTSSLRVFLRQEVCLLHQSLQPL